MIGVKVSAFHTNTIELQSGQRIQVYSRSVETIVKRGRAKNGGSLGKSEGERRLESLFPRLPPFFDRLRVYVFDYKKYGKRF